MEELEGELAWANERLKQRATKPIKAAEFSKLASLAIKEARRLGVVEQKRQRQEQAEYETTEALRAKYHHNYRQTLPQTYRRFADLGAAPLHPGSRAAFEVLKALELGDAAHLYGPPGVGKTHLIVWAGALLIEKYAVGVRFVQARDYLRFAFRRPEEDFDPLAPRVLIIDDLDKGAATPDNCRAVMGFFERAEHRLTLLSTANRNLMNLAVMWGGDELNTRALASRMSLVREIELKGDDFRLAQAVERGVL